MNSSNEMLSKLRSDAREIEEQIEKLCQPLKEELEKLRGAIAVYESRTKNQVVAEAVTDFLSASIPTAKLRNLSHADAVIAIAKHNGGVVRTQDAKRIMIKAGIMSLTKNSTNMAHNAIKRSDKFERVSPGEYRLKSEPKPRVESDGVFHTPVMPRSEVLESVARLGSRPTKPVQ